MLTYSTEQIWGWLMKGAKPVIDIFMPYIVSAIIVGLLFCVVKKIICFFTYDFSRLIGYNK